MEVIDSISDHDDTLTEKNEISLNYSKEDVEALVLKAEKLVMSHRGATVHYENSHNLTGENSSASDSDYESKVSRDWLVQSEPNINLRRSPSCFSQRRKKQVSTRRDWRHSLPECLEFWKQSNNLESEADESDDGRESQVSLPLSDLWEHDPFVTEAQEQSDNDKATLPANLANFGEDYSAYLYSDTETDSDLNLSSDEEVNEKKPFHKNYNCKISQSKSSFKNILQQINFEDFGLQLEKLDQLEEVCRKNVAILSEQAQLLENRQQIKSLKRLIVKWEKLKMNILDHRTALRDMHLLKCNIDNVGTDLDTLAGIISDEEGDQEAPEEDQELYDMRHQLFEQVKSHLLEISDSLLQLNMSLHKLRTKSKLVNPDPSKLEEKLQNLYEKWRLTHQAVTEAENKHHSYQMEKQHGEFSELLTEKLSRLVRTEEYVTNASDYRGENGDKSGGGGWWRSVVKYSLVTGVVLVSLVSASYVWSYNRCQHGYYSTIWPLITFTTTGPRPY